MWTDVCGDEITVGCAWFIDEFGTNPSEYWRWSGGGWWERRSGSESSRGGRGSATSAAPNPRYNDDFVSALARALSGFTPHPGTSGTLEVRQKVEVKPFKGKGDKQDDVDMQIDFMIFQSSFIASLQNDGLYDVLHDEPIPVGIKGRDPSELYGQYGRERVDKSLKVWQLLVKSVLEPTMLRLIVASGSPQVGWNLVVNHFSERHDDARERLDDEWAQLRQKPDEDVMDYLARCETLRLDLGSWA